MTESCRLPTLDDIQQYTLSCSKDIIGKICFQMRVATAQVLIGSVFLSVNWLVN